MVTQTKLRQAPLKARRQAPITRVPIIARRRARFDAIKPRQRAFDPQRLCQANPSAERTLLHKADRPVERDRAGAHGAMARNRRQKRTFAAAVATEQAHNLVRNRVRQGREERRRTGRAKS